MPLDLLLERLDDVVAVARPVGEERQHDDAEVAVGEHLADAEGAAAPSAPAAPAASPAAGPAAAAGEMPCGALFLVPMTMHEFAPYAIS